MPNDKHHAKARAAEQMARESRRYRAICALVLTGGDAVESALQAMEGEFDKATPSQETIDAFVDRLDELLTFKGVKI